MLFRRIHHDGTTVSTPRHRTLIRPLTPSLSPEYGSTALAAGRAEGVGEAIPSCRFGSFSERRWVGGCPLRKTSSAAQNQGVTQWPPRGLVMSDLVLARPGWEAEASGEAAVVSDSSFLSPRRPSAAGWL